MNRKTQLVMGQLMQSDSEPTRALSSYFTMVALDKHGRPRAVPPLIAETEEEIRLYEIAKKRREIKNSFCNAGKEK